MMLFFGVMALVWFGILIAGLIRGDYPTPDPSAAWRTSLYSVGTSLGCVALGWATLQRWVVPLWLSAAGALFTLVKALAGFVGYRAFLGLPTVPDSQQPYPEARFLALTTALVFSTLLLAGYVVALIAWYANRDGGGPTQGRIVR
jgi:hypothetical protein